MLNALIAVWAKAVEAEAAGSAPEAFADDTGATSHDQTCIQQVADITVEFAVLSNQELSAKKIFCFTTSRSHPLEIRLGANTLQSVDHAAVLGANLKFQDFSRENKNDEKITSAAQVAARITWLPLSFDQRSLLARALVVSKILHGSAVGALSQGLLKKLRSQIVTCLWGCRAKFRCREIVFSLLCILWTLSGLFRTMLFWCSKGFWTVGLIFFRCTSMFGT